MKRFYNIPALSPTEVRNYKGLLLEYCQKNRKQFPKFTSKNLGAVHQPSFVCTVSICDSEFASKGFYSKKIDAEQDASKIALEALSSQSLISYEEFGKIALNKYEVKKKENEKRIRLLYDVKERGSHEICHLPNDLWKQIILMLEGGTIMMLGRTCTVMYNLTEEDIFWKKFVKEYERNFSFSHIKRFSTLKQTARYYNSFYLSDEFGRCSDCKKLDKLVRYRGDEIDCCKRCCKESYFFY